MLVWFKQALAKMVFQPNHDGLCWSTF